MVNVLVLLFLAIGVIHSERVNDKCEHLLDVVAVIDGSETIFPNDFQTIREVMAKFVDDLGVETNNKHFGAVVYSTEVSEVIPLSGDREAMLSAMKTMDQPRAGTRTDLGIKEMINIFRTSGRPGVPQVAIVITDGASNEKEKTLKQAQIARDMGVNMFAIGVGGRIMDEELKGIASNEKKAFYMENFSKFAELLASFVKDVCPTLPPTPQVTDKPIQPGNPGPCDGCRMRNGIGYNVHSECQNFIQCEFKENGGLIRYHVKTCGTGTFWNQDKLTCDHMENVNCANDRCRSKVLESYKMGGNCAEYIECVNGKSKPATCRKSYFYSEINDLCLPDASCSSGGQTGGSKECNFARVPGDRCSYYWTFLYGSAKMPCPRGTVFNARACRCKLAGRNRCGSGLPHCQSLVDIDFNSAEPGEYDNYGAVVQNGLAYFDGKSNIKILRLANVDFRSKVTVKVAYKPSSGISEHMEQAVVTNGDCGDPSTISISNNGSMTYFKMRNYQDQVSTVQRYSSSNWHEVEYTFSDGKLTGLVNKGYSSTNVPGFVKRSQCAFQLGHGEGLRDFKGWIDYIIVSTC